MKSLKKRVVEVLGCAAMLFPGIQAQTASTAQRRLDLSAFALFSGTYTGLGSSPYATSSGIAGPKGRNITFSAGADLGFYKLRSFELGAEVRGSYPIDSGEVDGQKSILAGIRITHEPGAAGLLSHMRPYGNVLAGRGQMEYQNGGYLIPGTLYISSNSTVYDAGGGLELDITRQFSVKLDAQYHHWNTPVTPSGSLKVGQGGIGIIYRYGAGGSPR